MILNSGQNQVNWVVIVAAGTGNRLGGTLPKQFMSLGGREILDYSVQAFAKHPAIDGIIIVVAEPFIDRTRKQYPNYPVIVGGATRQESSARGVAACPNTTAKILIHDAARPFVSQHIISECLAALDDHDAAAPAVPVKDSIVMESGLTWQQVDRHHLRAMQTPQGFRTEIIRTAHISGTIGTDEIGLVLASNSNASVHLFEGDVDNFKITTPLDLELAAIVAARHRDR